MALGEMTFYSKEMGRNVNFCFLLPEGQNDFGKIRTLYLLHGHGNGNEEWLTGSSIKEIAYQYNLAVIMPSGENSFYLNHKAARTNYADYVGRELVDYTRKTFGLSDKREDTFIGGLSMGGFGALHTGLEFHKTFSKIMALSSALILYNIAGEERDFQDEFGDYRYYESIFGDLDNVMTSRVNPEQIVLDLQEKGEVIPEIFMACGTEDFLLENNRRFKHFLDIRGVPVLYAESAGDHNFKFWNPYLEAAVKWMV
nr:alpha/beta hydrolase family protein [uncultured Blautia sp.]